MSTDDETTHDVSSSDLKLSEVEQAEKDLQDAEREYRESKKLNSMNRHQRRAMYAVSSRSKPYCKARNKKKRQQRVIGGRRFIAEMLQKAINHNKTVVVLRKDKTAEAVKAAIRG